MDKKKTPESRIDYKSELQGMETVLCSLGSEIRIEMGILSN